MVSTATDVQPHVRFRSCASAHGLRLHRIHPMAGARVGTLQSTVVFDCRCGQRWLMRVQHGDVVSVDGQILEELRRARDGQSTAPPGSPAAPDE
jgi:hypothetical protein